MIGKIKLSVLGLTLLGSSMLYAGIATPYTYTFTLPQITVPRVGQASESAATWGFTMTSQGALVSAYNIDPTSITGGGPTSPSSTYLSSELISQGSLYGPELFFQGPGADNTSFSLVGSAAFWAALGPESFTNDGTSNSASWFVSSHQDPPCGVCAVNVVANAPAGAPEPQSLALLLVGFGVLTAAVRRLRTR